jgi:hypothetical protein
MSPSRITSVHPHRAIEGGRITLFGEDFDVGGSRLPDVFVQELPARVVFASPTRLSILVPSGLGEGGRVAVGVGSGSGESVFVDVATPFAKGLHQVDNPVFDRAGNLYVTYSGARGQTVPVSIFRVSPDGARETYSSAIPNPTSMAIDGSGVLYVSSRFEGTVFRVHGDGSAEPFANELGAPCGLALAPDGTLYVGDRGGTIFAVDPSGKVSTFATLPPSVAAFHLALGADALYATAPTLAPRDPIYRIAFDGTVGVHREGFGRPQGLAFGPGASLYVVEALAGSSGLCHVVEPGVELVMSGPGLVGVAFDPGGALIVCSNDTAYRLPRFA